MERSKGRSKPDASSQVLIPGKNLPDGSVDFGSFRVPCALLLLLLLLLLLALALALGSTRSKGLLV